MKSSFITQSQATAQAPSSSGAGVCKRAPKRWGVVVGINDYLNPLITDLDGAVTDAWSFYHYLTSPFGAQIPTNQVKLLVNEKATRANIEGAIGYIKACAQDQIYIYFAGHGLPENDREDNAFLLAYDSDPTNMVGSAISMQKISDFLTWRVGKAGTLLMLIDACHSGYVSLNKTRGFKMKPNDSESQKETTDRIKALNQSISKLSTGQSGWGVISASASEQVAEESVSNCLINQEPYEGGIFTCHILKALTGSANRDRNQEISIGEVYDFVSQGVNTMTQGKQAPQLSGSLSREMQVFTVPTQDILIPELPMSLRRKVKASSNARSVRNGALVAGGLATIAGAVLQGIAYQSVTDAEEFRPAEKTRADYVKLNETYDQSRVGSLAAYGVALTSGVVAGVSWWYETTSERRDRDAVYRRPPWFRLRPAQSKNILSSSLQVD